MKAPKLVFALVSLILACSVYGQTPTPTPNPRADVNGDGCINGADILEVRSPPNWNKCLGAEAPPTPPPTPAPAEQFLFPTPTPLPQYKHYLNYAPGATITLTRTVNVESQTYVGTSAGGSPATVILQTTGQNPTFKVWANNVEFNNLIIGGPWQAIEGLGSDHIFRNCKFIGPGDGVVYGEVIKPPTNRRILFDNCVFENTDYGLYMGGANITVVNCRMVTKGHSIRWWGVQDSLITNTLLRQLNNKNAIKLHALTPTSNVVLRNCDVYGHTRAFSIGPQYDDVTKVELVNGVVVQNCIFHGSPTIQQAVWIAAKNVTVSDCTCADWTGVPNSAVLIEPNGGWSGITSTTTLLGNSCPGGKVTR